MKQGGSFIAPPPGMPGMFAGPPGLSPPPKTGVDNNMSGGLASFGMGSMGKDNPMMSMKSGGPVRAVRNIANEEIKIGATPPRNAVLDQAGSPESDKNMTEEEKEKFKQNRRTVSKSLDISSRVFVPRNKGTSPAKPPGAIGQHVSPNVMNMMPGGMAVTSQSVIGNIQGPTASILKPFDAMSIGQGSFVAPGH